jgi:hypothetical protein
MLTIVSAVIEHSCRIMFFRHNGRGLPSNKGGVLYLLLAITLLARTVRDVMDPDGFSAATSIIASLLYVVLAMTLFRPASMAALLLVNLFGNIVVGGLYLAGVSNGYLVSAIFGWEAVALFVVLNKVVRQAQATHKKQNSSKN